MPDSLEVWAIWSQLFRGDRQGLGLLVDHLAHLADALGTLRLGAAVGENGLGRRSPTADGLMDVALADGVTVTDVHRTSR